jgi:hypothetical protein
MIARIVGVLLGSLLAAVGWAIVQPAGLVGSHLPPLPLGAFEPERYGVGYAAIVLGVVIFIAGLMPKGPSAAKARKPPTFVADFGTDVATEALETPPEARPTMVGGVSPPRAAPCW